MGKAEITRQKIIEDTAAIFNRQGYAGTSLSDLTRATGLSKGSIYGNFKNKDEVAMMALKFNIGQIVSAFQAEKSGRQHSIELLLAYPRAYQKIYRLLLERGGCPILNALADADDTHPELSRVAVVAIRQWRRELVLIIDQGKKKAEIKASLPAAALAENIISLIEGGSILAKTTGSVSYLENSIAMVEQMILAARLE